MLLARLTHKQPLNEADLRDVWAARRDSMLFRTVQQVLKPRRVSVDRLAFNEIVRLRNRLVKSLVVIQGPEGPNSFQLLGSKDEKKAKRDNSSS